MIRIAPQRASGAVEARVEDERIRQLFRLGPVSVSTSVVVAALLTSLVYAKVPALGLVYWWVFFLVVQAGRAAMLIAYRRKPERAPTKTWGKLYFALTFLCGCSWGLTIVWLYPQGSIAYQFFDVLVCMGMGAGAAQALSGVTIAYALFLLPAMLPSAVRMMTQSGELPHVTAVCALVYCAAMLLVARTNQRLLSSSLRLQFVNLELAQELEALATRDVLTGLPNRLILAERLTTALRRAARAVHDVAVIFVDCDDFKRINDTLGHASGDRYLQGIAAALQSAVREVDTVARLGGDEFIVLLERCGDKATVLQIVERIRKRTAVEIDLGTKRVMPHLSIGVSCYPGDGTDGETLIRQADEAMYSVKRSGGNGVRFFGEAAFRLEHA